MKEILQKLLQNNSRAIYLVVPLTPTINIKLFSLGHILAKPKSENFEQKFLSGQLNSTLHPSNNWPIIWRIGKSKIDQVFAFIGVQVFPKRKVPDTCGLCGVIVRDVYNFIWFPTPQTQWQFDRRRCFVTLYWQYSSKGGWDIGEWKSNVTEFPTLEGKAIWVFSVSFSWVK